ncbi:MAG: hypothetical protein IT230_04185 [Flavobacteriales bacterium]|nr:hypothetical protein [Flavobacteriales bacterium]
MTLEPMDHRTSIATLRVVTPHWLEIYYDNNVVFQVENVMEVQAQRRQLMGSRPYVTLTIIPADVDYNLNAMGRDQGKPDRGESQLLASAVVAKASMIEMLTRLYLSSFPQLHRTLVTHDEAAARAWLNEQLRMGLATAG